MKKKFVRAIAALLLAVSSVSVLSGCTSNNISINLYSGTWRGLNGSPVAGQMGSFSKYTTADASKPRKDGKKETIYKAVSWDTGKTYYLWKSTVDNKWYFAERY